MQLLIFHFLIHLFDSAGLLIQMHALKNLLSKQYIFWTPPESQIHIKILNILVDLKLWLLRNRVGALHASILVPADCINDVTILIAIEDLILIILVFPCAEHHLSRRILIRPVYLLTFVPQI